MSTSLRLALPRQLYIEMIAQAQAELPNECCGLLAGTIVTVGETRIGHVTRRYALVNEAASPTKYYSGGKDRFDVEMDRRQHGLEELAIYHSHPTSPPVPSKTDLEEWYYGPGVACIIISLQATEPEVRGWHLAADEFREAAWDVVDD